MMDISENVADNSISLKEIVNALKDVEDLFLSSLIFTLNTIYTLYNWTLNEFIVAASNCLLLTHSKCGSAANPCNLGVT